MSHASEWKGVRDVSASWQHHTFGQDCTQLGFSEPERVYNRARSRSIKLPKSSRLRKFCTPTCCYIAHGYARRTRENLDSSRALIYPSRAICLHFHSTLDCAESARSNVITSRDRDENVRAATVRERGTCNCPAPLRSQLGQVAKRLQLFRSDGPFSHKA